MDDRPPGGTRRSGNKTPRKVQWQDYDDESSEPSKRALDEHGLDLAPLEELKDALEKHFQSPSEFPPRPLSTADSASPESPVATDSKRHTVGGETYIGANETAGLPGTDIEAYSRRQASQLVQAHRRGFLGRFTPRSRSQSPASAMRHRRRRTFQSSDVDTDGETDVEQHAESIASAPRPRPGTSILSTLLSLYDHGAGGPSMLHHVRSFEDSRASSLYETTTNDTDHSARESPTPTPAGKRRRRPWDVFRREQPEPTRRSPGVFGALVASTSNLSGAAAPTPSTVAPSLKRPGYHLSRYSTREAETPRSTPLPPDDDSPVRRPPSAYFDQDQHTASSATLAGFGTATTTPTEESPPALNKGGRRQKWTHVLKDLPRASFSRAGTPTASTPGSPMTDTDEWLTKKDWERLQEKKERKRRRKKAEIYITRHVAEIIARQEFVCKLARAMMMFGGPSHRLQAQIQATARVLEIELSCMYLPDMMLISFDDPTTGTSNIKLIRQGGAFDISKLQAAYKLYWKVIHDDISVKDASLELDELMRKPPLYNKWQLIFFGGMCSASICSVSFSGSFLDCLISFPLGCLLIVIQLFAARHELYSNVFEITVATLFSFLAAALASTSYFCYSAVAASSIVLILPGYIILCGSLELSSHNIVSGAVRVCFSVIYSLFLGFGLAIGSSTFTKITKHQLPGQDDVTCSLSHRADGPWYQRTPSVKWAILTVPLYSLWLSLRFYAPWRRKELPLLVAISSLGWVCNHFTGLKFPNQSDISAAVGAFAVGLVSNLYARFFNGNAFVVMITGILFQLPSGVANGGLFTFVSKQDSGQSSNEAYLSGFQTALQLVSVSIGLTVGLGISLVCVFPIQSRKRAAGVFSL